MNKQELWLLVAPLDNPDVCFAVAAAAWAAQKKRLEFECYLESERTGQLFARTGSTVLGGSHHQQLNYLHARCDVKLILFGKTGLFDSSWDAFGDEILTRADSLKDFYAWMVQEGMHPRSLICVPYTLPMQDGKQADVTPYIYPEILFTESFACAPQDCDEIRKVIGVDVPMVRLWSDMPAEAEALAEPPEIFDYGLETLWMAERWKKRAKAVAFGDPDAIRSRIASLCMEHRVATYAPAQKMSSNQIRLSAYMEEHSPIAEETGALALEIGNPILIGRQTCDGDLFLWGKQGVSMQIMDPNRPAFPVIGTLLHSWKSIRGSLFDEEPMDEMLEKWADDGKVLCSLIFHSGEMAHNEAMLQLFDLCTFTGLKLGIAAHAARYETCPQMWELLQIPVSQGGLRGLIEPILHSGGLGIMGERACPPEKLQWHCEEAMRRIERIAGKENLPRGHYFFMDSDPETLSIVQQPLFDAVAAAGIEYAVSSAMPGRNCLLGSGIPVLNQSVRVQCTASPFLRITTAEDILESSFHQSPGWILGVMDAPVISFLPYIWQKGSRFMQIVDLMLHGDMINVLPHTLSRYACILQKKGLIKRVTQSKI